MKQALLGCLIITIAGLGTAAIVVIYALMNDNAFTLIEPVLDATVDHPAEAILGQPLTLTLTLTNPHDYPVTLDSIDIDNTFIAAFTVDTVTPQPTDTMHLDDTDQTSWFFERPLDPGETLDVTYTLTPAKAGRHHGNIEICNPNQDWQTAIAEITVAAPPTTP